MFLVKSFATSLLFTAFCDNVRNIILQSCAIKLEGLCNISANPLLEKGFHIFLKERICFLKTCFMNKFGTHK